MIGMLTATLLLAGAIHIASVLVAVLRSLRKGSNSTVAPSSPTSPAPAISILRPLCGLENHLEETLRSGFMLDWPGEVELIFCVERKEDPAADLARRLMQSYPSRKARLLVGEDPVSINPKLNNLVKGWEAATHDIVVMADSNVLMPRDYLQQIMARWEPGVTGMVCSPPVGSAPDGWAAEIECAWLNSHEARWQLIADELGLGFAQGKTMMLEKSLLDAEGGIRRLGEEVAEDAAATKIVRNAGLNVRLVTRPFPQPLGSRDWRSVWRRQLRWARLRRASFPLFFLPELLAGGALPMLGAGLMAVTGHWSPISALAYAALWYGAEVLLIAAFRWPLSARTLPALVVRDLALPALFAAAWFGSGFEWRGNRMTVKETQGPDRHARPHSHQPGSLVS